MATRFVRKTIVEDAGFLRAWCVALDDESRGSLAQVSLGLFPRANQFNAYATLPYVGFEHERKIDAEPRADLVQFTGSRLERGASQQFRFSGELRASPVKFVEGRHLGFAHYAAGENTRVCCSRHSQPAIFQSEPRVVDCDRGIKHPGGPKLPMPPATETSYKAIKIEIHGRATKQLQSGKEE